MTSQDERLLVDGVRRLRDDVLEPTERALDGLPPPATPSGDERYTRALAQAHEMGLHRVAVPEDYGGLGAGADLALRVGEELADGAPGLAGHLLREGLLLSVAARVAGTGAAGQGLREALAEEAARPGALALAVLQPGGGRDAAVALPHANLRFRSTAHRTGGTAGAVTVEDGGLRLQGVRLPQVAGGDRCSHLLLLTGPPPGDRLETYLVPLDGHGGVRRGEPVRRMGLRLDQHADVAVDDLLLGAGARAVDAPGTAALLEQVLAAASLGMAARAVGIAARAYDVAFEYSCTRVQGGKPIIEHESVAEVLWHTHAAIDTVRRALRDVAATADGGLPPLRAALAARSAAAGMVGPATIEMTELLGGYGITTEYPLEKLYRDTRTLLVGSGVVEGAGVVVDVSLS